MTRWLVRGGHRKLIQRGQLPPRPRKRPDGYKVKDLCMIPARMALALQQDGWYLRSEIVWNNPQPTPESVADRPTRSHSFVYLLTKAPDYYYDPDAVREASGRNRLSV
jgi:hypothetical protein